MKNFKMEVVQLLEFSNLGFSHLDTEIFKFKIQDFREAKIQIFTKETAKKQVICYIVLDQFIFLKIHKIY